MQELSLHVMDIVENGVAAGATLIRVSIDEDRRENRLTIEVNDNGRGMSEDLIQKALDPFFTTRTTRRVGLGLSLFREAARRCGGNFWIESREGEGTRVRAAFELDHIDRAPMGDLAGSMSALIVGNPAVDFVFRHTLDGDTFELDTREVKAELEDVPISHPDVVRFIEESIREAHAPG